MDDSEEPPSLEDLYALFGCGTNASDAEVTQAFRTLARRFHPDTTIGLPDWERLRSEQLFRLVSDAYRILSAAQSRNAYRFTVEGQEHAESVVGDSIHVAGRPDDQRAGPPPGSAPSCEICGARPAAPIKLRRNVGLLVARRVYSIDATVCEPCARVLTQEFQVESLKKGWFGGISAPLNVWNLGANAVRAAGHRRRLDDEPRPAARPRSTRSVGDYKDLQARFPYAFTAVWEAAQPYEWPTELAEVKRRLDRACRLFVSGKTAATAARSTFAPLISDDVDSSGFNPW